MKNEREVRLTMSMVHGRVAAHRPSKLVASRVARSAHADNLKVLLVVGVIVAHATMAWTDNDAWVLEEPPVREPLLTVLNLAALVGVSFAMATFFLIAGTFTPRSLERKGLRRFVVDRTVRFGVPLVFYMLVLGPIVEFADAQDNAGWNKGFWAFVKHSWRHPAPGPLWFLEVLLVFSVVYAVVRTIFSRRTTTPEPLNARYLLTAGIAAATAFYAVRLVVTFEEEVGQDLFLGQAPAWVTAFTLGVVGGERGWFERISPAMSRRLFQVAWSAAACVVVVVSVNVGAMGADIEEFWGDGTWQSAVLAVLQAALVVAMSIWLLDVFRRRLDHQGSLMVAVSRAAFAAFIVHQVVLVGTVLATRHVDWPPEVEFPVAAALAVIGSFGIGALLVRLPRVSRFV
jgi:fucose 4-O-acetylase-like acetyltransferase